MRFRGREGLRWRLSSTIDFRNKFECTNILFKLFTHFFFFRSSLSFDVEGSGVFDIDSSTTPRRFGVL